MLPTLCLKLGSSLGPRAHCFGQADWPASPGHLSVPASPKQGFQAYIIPHWLFYVGSGTQTQNPTLIIASTVTTELSPSPDPRPEISIRGLQRVSSADALGNWLGAQQDSQRTMNKKAFLSLERHFLIGSRISNSARPNFKDQWHIIQNSIWVTCLVKIWTWGRLQASEASLTPVYLPVWLMFTRCPAFQIFQGKIYKQWHAWSLVCKHSKCRKALSLSP